MITFPPTNTDFGNRPLKIGQNGKTTVLVFEIRYPAFGDPIAVVKWIGNTYKNEEKLSSLERMEEIK